ncbi:MAG TPA: hypothetical protein VJN95_15615 [Gemmatimonadales bacterium]|nr:hypothetical protein [Gemmatimonadales bacterium]
MPSKTTGSALLLLSVLGCAGGSRAPAAAPVPTPTNPAIIGPSAPTAADADLADAAGDVITASLQADARQEDADSLYLRGAIVIADGHRRDAWPRYAGVEPGGAVAIGGMQVVVRDRLIWAVVDYRWYSIADNLARQCQATVLLSPPDGTRGFRIVHLHSSIAR